LPWELLMPPPTEHECPYPAPDDLLEIHPGSIWVCPDCQERWSFQGLLRFEDATDEDVAQASMGDGFYWNAGDIVKGLWEPMPD